MAAETSMATEPKLICFDCVASIHDPWYLGADDGDKTCSVCGNVYEPVVCKSCDAESWVPATCSRWICSNCHSEHPLVDAAHLRKAKIMAIVGGIASVGFFVVALTVA